MQKLWVAFPSICRLASRSADDEIFEVPAPSEYSKLYKWRPFPRQLYRRNPSPCIAWESNDAHGFMAFGRNVARVPSARQLRRPSLRIRSSSIAGRRRIRSPSNFRCHHGISRIDRSTESSSSSDNSPQPRAQTKPIRGPSAVIADATPFETSRQRSGGLFSRNEDNCSWLFRGAQAHEKGATFKRAGGESSPRRRSRKSHDSLELPGCVKSAIEYLPALSCRSSRAHLGRGPVQNSLMPLMVIILPAASSLHSDVCRAGCRPT